MISLLNILLGSILESIIRIQEIWIRFQMKRIEKKLRKIELLLNSIPEEEKKKSD